MVRLYTAHELRQRLHVAHLRVFRHCIKVYSRKAELSVRPPCHLCPKGEEDLRGCRSTLTILAVAGPLSGLV